MAGRKSGLGRNLNMLLGQKAAVVKAQAQPAEGDKMLTMPVNQLQPGQFQPRRVMDPQALNDLANSIKAQGILQPIIVRPVGTAHEIIAGERRWRAAKQAGLKEVPVIVKTLDDKTTLALALIENMQREDLNVLEEAKGLHRLTETFELTHQEVADVVGKSRTSVTNLLRLMQLNKDVQLLLENGDLEFGHAKALLSLSGIKQSEAAKVVVAQGLSVRETESLVRRMQQGPGKAKSDAPQDPRLDQQRERLCHELATKVEIQQNPRGKGKIVIHYQNSQQLDLLLQKI